MTSAQRDQRIRQLEVELIDATDSRYERLSNELVELVAQSNAERGTTPLDLQEETPTPNDNYRAALRRAVEERRRLAEKPSTAPQSVTGGVMRTTIVNV